MATIIFQSTGSQNENKQKTCQCVFAEQHCNGINWEYNINISGYVAYLKDQIALCFHK